MVKHANYRIYRTRINFLAVSIIIVLAVFLYIRIGEEPARIVLEATGMVGITLISAQFIMEKWLWKTWLGQLLGFPPNYSGIWVGNIHRLKNNTSETPDESEIQVSINQEISDIEWNQTGYDKDGNKLAESHFILGEVIDYHRKWDGIVGVYEVKRPNGTKDEGMGLLTVNEELNEISGIYCGVNGNVGKMILKRKILNES